MRLNQFLKSTADALFQLIYPPVCTICNTPIHRFHHLIPIICPDCLEDLPRVSADHIQTHILNRLTPCYLDGLYVTFQFNPTLQSIIHHIKYQKMIRLAQNAGILAASCLSHFTTNEPLDLIIPVPLHPVREKERGYNQSYHIARGLFSQSGLPIHQNLLRRIRHTRSQTELNREERRNNVDQAFQVVHDPEIKGKTIALIDDVVTTGATLNECARVLKLAGARRVLGFTLSTPLD